MPEMKEFAKCVDLFSLTGKDLKNLFSKAFFGAVNTQKEIVLDTRFFKQDRLESLVQIIVVLLLLSDRPDPILRDMIPIIDKIRNEIKGRYEAMDTDPYLELVRPSTNSKTDI